MKFDQDALFLAEQLLDVGADISTVITTYLEASGSVIVPEEPTEAMVEAVKGWKHSYVHGPRSFLRHVVQASQEEA